MIEYDIQSDFCNLLYKNLEMQTIHPPYEQELRELHCIENGDLELLEKTIPQSYDDSYNAILAKNPIRHIKNLGIVVVTLACRAAIRGGIDPEISFSLSDTYINKIESLDERVVFSGIDNDDLELNINTLDLYSLKELIL